jgi:hypothetical protein
MSNTESVLGAPLEEFVSRHRPFWLVMADVVNWTDIAFSTGMARIDDELEVLRTALQDLLPAGARSSTVTTGVFAYLIDSQPEEAMEACRAALRRLASTRGDVKMRIGIAGWPGPIPLRAGDLAARATWALAEFARDSADGIAMWGKDFPRMP